MKVSFFSNFLNHHQLPFCLEMIKLYGNDFKFVATEKITDDRIKLGYEDMNAKYDFVVRAYEDENKANELAKNSDVVIIGSAPTKYIISRILNNKLTIRYSERIFKNNFSLKSIKSYCSLIIKKTFFEKNVYLLCSSAFSCRDYNIAGSFINRCFKWGYFPEFIKYKSIDNIIAKKKENSILWAGRFLKWKHPEKVIDLAIYLKKKNVDFTIKMIGIGPEFNNIKNMIKKNKLNKYVELIGSLPPEKVRENMENAQIYLFTSDKYEGWGAVLNESMNSGCAVVCNSLIGAVPFLVKHDINGLIYSDKDNDSFYEMVFSLLIDKKKCNRIGKNAYYTICEFWNPCVAANNLKKFIDAVLNKQDVNSLFLDGPCSKANILFNNWFDDVSKVK